MLGQGYEMAGKVSGVKNKQLEERVATNRVNWQQFRDMAEHKKSTLKRQSL